MLKEGFYRVELNKTGWEVPQRYQNLSPVGSGAYGQVRKGGAFLSKGGGNAWNVFSLLLVHLFLICCCYEDDQRMSFCFIRCAAPPTAPPC